MATISRGMCQGWNRQGGDRAPTPLPDALAHEVYEAVEAKKSGAEEGDG